MVACSTPTVDGTEIDSQQGASTGKRGKRSSTPKADPSDDDDDVVSPGNGSSSSSSGAPPMTTTTAVPTTTTTTPTTTATTTAPPPTTTATTPPPPTTPACASNDPIACLECCLDANPGATIYEDDYDACMQTCPQGDIACLDSCQVQHVSACAANATCTKHHSCMEANNCLKQNYCNPI